MKRRLVLLKYSFLLSFLTFASAFAQAPTITSFTPNSGPVGTEVTISGTNFDATPENNIVFFGATEAIVELASSTELTVTVPIGATYTPITVLTNELIAWSSSPFVVTSVGGNGNIDLNSFAAPLSNPIGSNPTFVAVSDLDGDGKVDLAVANSGDDIVSIIRNNNTGPGNISYASKVDYSTGSNPFSVAIGDLDGDGKADIVVANQNSATVSVFRNTSSGVGIISFDTKEDYVTGTNPFSVAIGDLDGDGRADMVVANNNSGSISIFRNSSTGAGNISFDGKVDYTVGTSPNTIAIGDLDGDDKADLAVSNFNSASISTFRNISTGAGNISFDAKIDYTTGSGPVSVVIGDLDDDGKPDLAVANLYNGSASVFRNISTAIGIIDFTAKVDYSTGSQPRSVAMGDIDGDGKVDLAIANYNSASTSIFRNLSTGNGSIDFATKVDYTTGELPRSVAIGDLDGDGKTGFVVANLTSNTLSLFRNARSESDIIDFSVVDQIEPAAIDASEHTVMLSVPSNTDINAVVATFELSIGASAAIDGTAQISGTTSNDFSNSLTYTITAEDGFTTQNWLVTVNKVDQTPPEIRNDDLPEMFSSGQTNITASVDVIDNIEINAVEFHSRHLNTSAFTKSSTTKSVDIYSKILSESDIADNGLEYFFLALDTSGNNVSTDTVQIVIQYTVSNSPTIPGLGIGGKAENWRMFSIPHELENNFISAIFDPVLNTYDDTKWRLFHYQNDNSGFMEYTNGLSKIERGKSYWFNSLNAVSVQVGAGTSPTNTDDNLASIALSSGWNQIGNPYAFDVSWNDVLAHNNITNEVESNLRITNDGTSLENSTTLKAYGGAYLFASQVITLEVPLTNPVGGRVTDRNDFSDGWLLNLNLKSGKFSNTVSGIGMHPDAMASNDRYDQIRAPRFINYIDATFEHPEFLAGDFSRDIVPEADNFVWEFTVSSNIDEKLRVMSWDASAFSDDKKLVLIDQVTGNIIDMIVATSYSYAADKTRKFKIIYGDNNFLNDQFGNDNLYLGTNFPNPFVSRTTIPYSIYGNTTDNHVRINVFSLDGKLVKTLVDDTFSSGNYNTQWDAKDQSGKNLTGMFICTLEVQTSEGVWSQRIKMIVQ